MPIIIKPYQTLHSARYGHLRIINKKSYFTVKFLLSFRVNHFNNAVDVPSL